MLRVNFPTCSPFLARDLKQLSFGSTEGMGEIYEPDPISGRYPGVVIVEGLGGFRSVRERAYAAFLAAQGCVVLAIDSFAARRAARLPDEFRALLVTESMLLADAYAGLRYLRDHPAVDPDRIYTLGFSYGGMISVLCAYSQFADQLAPDGSRFAGHASYYGCSVARLDVPETSGAPVMMLFGELDRNVSIDRARTTARELREAGSDVEMTVIPGAYHQWDGEDVEKRHVRFNLQESAIRVDRDNEMFDEHTGFPISGPLSRAYTIMRHASMTGYDIRRDEAALRYSDERLLSFIDPPLRDISMIDLHVEATRPPQSAEGHPLLRRRGGGGLRPAAFRGAPEN